jgi:hypothetical protein
MATVERKDSGHRVLAHGRLGQVESMQEPVHLEIQNRESQKLPQTGEAYRAQRQMLLLGLGAAAVCFALFEALRILQSRLRPAVVLNPALIAKTGLDGAAVAVIPLGNVGGFATTTKGIVVLGPRNEVVLDLPGLQAEKMDLDNALVRHRAERNTNPARIDSHNWLASVQPQGARRQLRHGWPFSVLAGGALGAVLGLPLSIAVYLASLFIGEARQWDDFEQRTSYWGANEYFYFTSHVPDPLGLVTRFTDREARRREAVRAFDEERFLEAVTTNDVQKFRSYVNDSRKPASSQTIPLLGKHVPEARAKITSLYAIWSAEHGRRARAHGADPRIIQGVQAVLTWLGEDDDFSPNVGLSFVHPNELDVDRLTRAATAAGEVAKVGVLFTDELNRAREESMTRALRSALGGYFKPAQLTLTSNAEPGRPRLLMHSRLTPTGDNYFRTAELRLPLAQRKAYPGVALDFNFRLQLPEQHGGGVDPTSGAGIHERANPAPQFKVRSAGTGRPSDKAVYQVMVETAFNVSRTKSSRVSASSANLAPRLRRLQLQPQRPLRVSGPRPRHSASASVATEAAKHRRPRATIRAAGRCCRICRECDWYAAFNIKFPQSGR